MTSEQAGPLGRPWTHSRKAVGGPSVRIIGIGSVRCLKTLYPGGRLAMATFDQVRRAAPQDLHEIISALSRAFFDDPIFAWALPDADRRRRVLPEFFALYSQAYLRHDQ